MTVSMTVNKISLSKAKLQVSYDMGTFCQSSYVTYLTKDSESVYWYSFTHRFT